MSSDVKPLSYVQLLHASVGRCASIDPEDRVLPSKRDATGAIWVFRRDGSSSVNQLFANDNQANQPFQLVKGGRLEFYVRIRKRPGPRMEVVAYRVALLDLPENDNRIESMRFDRSDGKPGGDGWDDEICDNPQHPWAHMHINFHLTLGSNDCRMPTGRVCPILLLRTIDHWYYTTFVQ